jgi:hypothetical protein
MARRWSIPNKFAKYQAISNTSHQPSTQHTASWHMVSPTSSEILSYGGGGCEESGEGGGRRQRRVASSDEEGGGGGGGVEVEGSAGGGEEGGGGSAEGSVSCSLLIVK